MDEILSIAKEPEQEPECAKEEIKEQEPEKAKEEKQEKKAKKGGKRKKLRVLKKSTAESIDKILEQADLKAELSVKMSADLCDLLVKKQSTKTQFNEIPVLVDRQSVFVKKEISLKHIKGVK